MAIVTQVSKEVKCIYDGCEEEVFRDGLCWDHFKEVVIADWASQSAEKQTCSEGTGHVFDCPAILGSWWGDPVEEVCK